MSEEQNDETSYGWYPSARDKAAYNQLRMTMNECFKTREMIRTKLNDLRLLAQEARIDLHMRSGLGTRLINIDSDYEPVAATI